MTDRRRAVLLNCKRNQHQNPLPAAQAGSLLLRSPHMASSGKKTKKSEIVPLLIGPIICDVAAQDPSSGKISLIGVFSNINVAKFPTARQITVYFRLSDAQGQYHVEVRFVRADDGEVIAKAEAEATVKTRFDQPELTIQFPPLPLTVAATYEFQVWANDVFLGSNSLTVRQSRQQRSN